MATTGAQLVGISGTLTVNGEDLLPDVQTKLVEYDLQSSPIITIMSRVSGGVMDTVNPRYEWQEVQYDEPSVDSATAIASVGAGVQQLITIETLAVVTGDTFLEPTTNQLFEVQLVDDQDVVAETSDVYVKQVPTTLSTTPVAGTPMLIRMGNTMIEGGYYPSSTMKKPVRVSNTITQVASQIEITELMKTLPTYHGYEFDFQKKHKITQFRADMERRFIWGKSMEETRTQSHGGNTATGIARNTKGVWNSITTNIDTYAGTITEATLDSWLQDVVFGAKYSGSDLKLGFCGPSFLGGISSFVKQKIRVLNSTPTYGLAISEYIAPFGNRRLYLIEEREFKQNPAYEDTIMALDPGYLKIRKPTGQPLITVKPTKVPNKDTDAIGMVAYFGVQLEAEPFHAVLKH